MKYKTNSQKIDDFMKQIGTDHKCYSVITITAIRPYNPSMTVNSIVKRDELRDRLNMLARYVDIYHISLSSSDSGEIVMILR